MAFTLALAAGHGASLFPALAWQNAPARTQSFVLLCHDPAALGGDRAYWLRYDLPASLTCLPAGDRPAPGQLIREAPLPAPGGLLLYFELYALDIPTLSLPAGADWDAVDAAMEGHLLSRARLFMPLERTPIMMTDNPDDLDILTDTAEDESDDMDDLPDGDRQLSTDSAAIDTGTNDSDLGANVAGDIGPKHDYKHD